VYFNPPIERTGPKAPETAHTDGRESAITRHALHGFRMQTTKEIGGLFIVKQRLKVLP
jgi:hypothetical protein